MLITWMAYAALFTSLVTVAALALDHVSALWNVPRRGVWVAALVVSTALPVLLAFARATPAPASAMTVASVSSVAVTGLVAPGETVGAPPPATRVWWRLPAVWNTAAAYMWTAASLALAALLMIGAAKMWRQHRSWRTAHVGGESVFIATNVGPAVIGALRPRIVLPEWALELDASQRALMLRHEAEHVRAHDPALLLVGAMAIVLFPWNAALWIVVQRLRLAIEIDCDRRVLRTTNLHHDYASLLLSVGARRTTSHLLTASLVAPRPLLERRIVAMTSIRPPRPLLAAVPFLASVVVVAAIAAQTPRPAPLLREEVAPSVDRVPVAPIAPTPPIAAKTVIETAAKPTLREEPRITALWENAPIDEVISVFAEFSGRKFHASKEVGGTISADVRNEPWDQAFKRIMTAAGYKVSVDSSRIISIEAAVARSTPPAVRREPVTKATIRKWIELLQPQLLRGDTSNYVGFAVDENGNVVRSAVGYDPGLDERLATIAAARAAMRVANPVIVGRDSLLPVEIHGSGRGVTGAAPPTSKTPLIGLLHGPDEEIQTVEGMNTFAGEIIDRPLEVLILFLKKG